MDSRLLATIIIFPIWLTLILVFRRHRQWLLYYLVAAFGLTIMIVFLAEHFGWDQILVNLASYQVYLITKYVLHIPIEIMNQGRFQLFGNQSGGDILKLGIECSAILESSIAVSLIIFYPLFNWKQKILRASFGLVVTYVINIIRLLIIVLMANKFGPDYIFVAHAGVARIFFFLCEVILYWYLLTKPTVKSVGDSISQNVPLSQTAKVGRSLMLRHAVMQILVIVTFVILSVASFRVSKDWQIAFRDYKPKERPIIYQEETSLEQGAKPQVLGASKGKTLKQMAVNGLDGNGGAESRLLPIENVNRLNLHLQQGSQTLQVEMYINRKFFNRAIVDVNADDQASADKMIFAKGAQVFPGDTLELRFKNLGQSTGDFLISVMAIQGEDNE